MPCSDMTERLELELDPEDRILAYHLTKVSCGANSGQNSSVIKYLEGRAVCSLHDLSPEKLLEEIGPIDAMEEFMVLKHFEAVRGGIAVYLGFDPGGRADYCTVVKVDQDSSGTRVVALINAGTGDLPIASCGSGCDHGQSNR